jgi:hypothetical protein
LINEKFSQEYHSFLKHSCKFYFYFYFYKNLADHKKKIDAMVTDQDERMRKLNLLKQLKERFYQNN